MTERYEDMTKLGKSLLWLFLVFAFLFILTYFRTKKNPPEIIDEHRDTSWLTGNPCSVPCWYGLIPGESTMGEMGEVVSKLPFIVIDSREEFLGRGNDQIIYDIYEHEKGDGSLSFNFSDGVISRIHQKINYNITLSRVVSIHGEPDFIEVIPHPQIKGEGYCAITLVWIDESFIVEYRIINGETFWEECEEIENGRVLDRDGLVTFFAIIGDNLEPERFSFLWPGLSK